MTQYTVTSDTSLGYRFDGEALGSVNDDEALASSYTELTLYRTARRKLISSRVVHDKLDATKTTHSAKVSEDASGVIDHLGFGPLAKELYSATGMETTEYVR